MEDKDAVRDVGLAGALVPVVSPEAAHQRGVHVLPVHLHRAVELHGSSRRIRRPEETMNRQQVGRTLWRRPPASRQTAVGAPSLMYMRLQLTFTLQ